MSGRSSSPSLSPVLDPRPQLVQDLARVADFKTIDGEFKKLNGVTSRVQFNFKPSPLIAMCGLGALAFDAFRKANPLLTAGLTILTLAAGLAGVKIKSVPAKAYQELADLFDRCTLGLRDLWNAKSEHVCEQLNQSNSSERTAKKAESISTQYNQVDSINFNEMKSNAALTARYIHAAASSIMQEIAKIDTAAAKTIDPLYKQKLTVVQQEVLRVLYGKPSAVPVKDEPGTSRKKEEDPAYVQFQVVNDNVRFAAPWAVETK